jgi:hypothetical protein
VVDGVSPTPQFFQVKVRHRLADLHLENGVFEAVDMTSFPGTAESAQTASPPHLALAATMPGTRRPIGPNAEMNWCWGLGTYPLDRVPRTMMRSSYSPES